MTLRLQIERKTMPARLNKSLFFLLLISIPSISADNELLRAHRRKHDAKLESWSFAVRLHNRRDTIHAVAFMVSGKLLFMSGNYVYSGVYDNTNGTYKSKGKALLFESVRHNYEKLDQRFGSNRIALDHSQKILNMNVKLPEGIVNISAPLQKNSIWFKDIFTKARSQSRFNWYIQPLTGISATLEDKKGIYRGEGYFQHFWGRPGAQEGDWIVAHLEDGTMLIGAHFHPDLANTPWLPDDYILIIKPNGSKILKNSVSLLVNQTCLGKKGSYPTSIIIKTNQGDKITFDAYKVNQLSKIANREKWNGFGTVNAVIDGKERRGWAYYSPYARKE